MSTTRSYGAILNDKGAHRFEKIEIESTENLPVKYGYRYRYVPIDNQNALGVCVSYGVGHAVRFYHKIRTGVDVAFSYRGIYSNAKLSLESNDLQDDGLQVSDGLTSAMQWLALEMNWPSTDNLSEGQFPQWVEPVPENLRTKDWLPKSFVRLEDISVEQMKLALFKHGPLVIGTNWLDSWEDINADGRLPTQGKPIGGHCVNITDWNDKSLNLDGSVGAFVGPNNWGADWGDSGYFHMPYNAIGNISDVYTLTA